MSIEESKHDTYSLHAVKAQGRLLELIIPESKKQIDELVDGSSFFDGIKKIYIVGCGDSLFAGVSARFAFDKFTGIPTEALDSLEFSRYIVDYVSKDTLVIGISKSGRVPRTLECVDLANQIGAKTLGITEYETGLLAKLAQKVILQPMPDFGPGWEDYDEEHHIGLGNYVHSYLTLLMLSIKLGEKYQKLSSEDAESLRKELSLLPEGIIKTSEANIETAKELALRFWNLDTFFYVGAGPNYGSAMFSSAKMLEQPNLNGVPSQTEEWAHLQYFLTRPGIFPFFFMVPEGRSRDRALEQINASKDMGGPTVVICQSDDDEAMKYADCVFKIYGKVREEFSPFLFIIPGELFATAMHQTRGRMPLLPQFGVDKMSEINSRQIRTGCRRLHL